jgi:hypothetical protein
MRSFISFSITRCYQTIAGEQRVFRLTSAEANHICAPIDVMDQQQMISQPPNTAYRYVEIIRLAFESYDDT